MATSNRTIPDDRYPVVLAMQPRPIHCRPVNLATGLMVRLNGEAVPQIVGGVAREWTEGDSGPGGRCTRCAICSASDNRCLLIANHEIAEHDAWDYSPLHAGDLGCGRVGRA